ncbi:serine/threonine-protein kinase [Stigmatella hybrida]|uniref:serine/threonine-protein kinase n=1 Tax=Stigmatella hybrida TaxID=394097 RepID=UPI001CDA5FED|nr:serine/threonine-protein kinase [Stigmatella hybrida]
MQDENEAKHRITVAEGLSLSEQAKTLREGGRPHGNAAPSIQLDLPPVQAHSKVDPPFPVANWERYQGVRFLGQGGMGQVFLAYDPRLRRNVALKFVKGDDAELTRRFLTEARAQARVEHERVCQVFEVGKVHGRSFIAMQFVDGRPLSQLVNELSLEQKVMMLRGAAEGVHAAHRAGLIHRDLKPSNILVERTEDGRLKPFVMDFGLAREWNEIGATATGAVLGTPHFMSPEQARGEVVRLDRRTDVYSLGATLYHLITGHQAIPGNNGLEVLTNIALVDPISPRAQDPDIPRDLEAIVLKCLEKERSARYDSARSLVEDLERFLDGSPVLARPTGLGYRLRKKALKHWVAVSVSALALLAAMLALGWAVFTQRNTSERERLARLFTEKVEHIEALSRYSGLSPLHDTRKDRQEIRKHMADLEREILQAQGLATAPGLYALGRSYLSLGNEPLARQHTEAAWRSGYREPRVAYTLALTLGHLYQEGLLEAEHLRSPQMRESRRRNVENQYRAPALEYLRQSQGTEVPSPEYVTALIAFYEGRFEDALIHLGQVGQHLPWFHEIPLLMGDILQARAAQRWNSGQSAEAQADLDAGRQAYTAATSIGRSAPAVHRALAKLEYTAMVLGVYGTGDTLNSFTRGMEAVTRALQILPEDPESLLLAIRFRRRLVEAKSRRGEDFQQELTAALAEVHHVLQSAPLMWEAYFEKSLLLSLSANLLKDRGQNPQETLRDAFISLQQVPPEFQNDEFHNVQGLLFFAWAGYEDDIGIPSSSHWLQAIGSFEAASRLSPFTVGVWTNLAMANYRYAQGLPIGTPDEQREQALERSWESIKRALTLNPQHWVSYFYGGNLHSFWAEINPCGNISSAHHEEALSLFRQGLSIAPHVPNLHNGMGGALYNQARRRWESGSDAFATLEEAQKSYEKAIRLAPMQVYGHSNRGDSLLLRAVFQLDLGQDTRATLRLAVAAFEQAVRLAPELADHQANLGKGLARLADSEMKHNKDPRIVLQRAENNLREALRLNPQHAQAWADLGVTYGIQARWQAQWGKAGNKDFEKATQAFEKALSLAQDNIEARLAFGTALHSWATSKKGADSALSAPLERGLVLTEEVLATCPDMPRALLLRAKLRMSQANNKARPEEQQELRTQARGDASRALEKSPYLASGWEY